MKGHAPALRLGAAAAFTTLALLPISNWIPGGHSAPFYPLLLGEWWSGTLIAVGAGVVLALASRRMDGFWHAGVWTWSRSRPLRFTSRSPGSSSQPVPC